jgi:hypothetical protein
MYDISDLKKLFNFDNDDQEIYYGTYVFPFISGRYDCNNNYSTEQLQKVAQYISDHLSILSNDSRGIMRDVAQTVTMAFKRV